MNDIDTAVVDSLKVLDLKWPIREEKRTFAGAVGMSALCHKRISSGLSLWY